MNFCIEYIKKRISAQEMMEYDLECGKDADGYYIPITNNDTFITKIIDEFKLDETFKNMVIYGNSEYPLFLLKTIREILEIPQTNLDRAIKKYNSDEIVKNCKCKIAKKDKEGNLFFQKHNDIYLLTKYGLYRSMFLSDKSMAEAFRKFVYIILDKLEKTGEVKLQEAIEETKKKLEIVKEKCNELTEKNLVQSYQITRLKQLDECLSDKNIFSMSGNFEYLYREAIEHLVFMNVPLYIVDDKHILYKYLASEKKKKRDEHEEDTETPQRIKKADITKLAEKYDLTIYERKFNEFCPYELYEFEEELMYYSIHSFKSTAKKNPKIYHKICDIKILDREHYKDILEYLNNDYKTIAKNIFHVGYNNIKDIIKRSIIDRYYQHQKKIKDN